MTGLPDKKDPSASNCTGSDLDSNSQQASIDTTDDALFCYLNTLTQRTSFEDAINKIGSERMKRSPEILRYVTRYPAIVEFGSNPYIEAAIRDKIWYTTDQEKKIPYPKMLWRNDDSFDPDPYDDRRDPVACPPGLNAQEQRDYNNALAGKPSNPSLLILLTDNVASFPHSCSETRHASSL